MAEDRRICIVTGAASGIGRAVALALAGPAVELVLADRDGAGLEALVRDLAGVAPSCRAHPVVADLARRGDCEAVVEAGAALGGLDVLANVAGVMAAGDTVEHLDDETLEWLVAVNLLSVFRLGRHAIGQLRRRGGGVIVNTASVHAFASMPGTAAYAASKGAIVALTRQMALDLAPDRIRVVAVAPGSVDTPLTRRAVEATGRSVEELGFSRDRGAVGRVAAAEETAAVVRWLASAEAGAVNGTTVVADSALLARLV